MSKLMNTRAEECWEVATRAYSQYVTPNFKHNSFDKSSFFITMQVWGKLPKSISEEFNKTLLFGFIELKELLYQAVIKS